MDFVGFLPQIIDVEDGNYIVDYEEQQRERETLSFLKTLIIDPDEDLEENEEG